MISKNSGSIPRSSSTSQILPQNEKLRLMEALDHLFVTKQYQDIGSCSVCKKICTENCVNCGIRYCSVECQNSDCTRHKAACMKPYFRGIVSDNISEYSSASVNRSVDNEADNMCQNERLLLGNHGSPFKSLLKQMNKRTGNLSRENHSTPTSCRFLNETKSVTGNERKMMTDFRNEYKKPWVNKERVKNSEQSQPKTPPHSREVISEKNREVAGGKKGGEEWAKSPSRPGQTISEAVSPTGADSFGVKEVVCTFRENENRYWVMDAKDSSKYAEIQTILARECDDYESVPPREGLVCGCTFGSEWYRGRVISVHPKTSVHFIDYGNKMIYELNSVKKLPDDLKYIPGLAFLIEFERGCPSQYNYENLDALTLTVRETRKTSDGVSCVRVDAGYYGFKTEGCKKEKIGSGSARERRFAVNELAKGSKGMIFFGPGRGKVRFGSIVPDGNENAKKCLEQIIKFNSSKSSPIEGKEEDDVLVADKEGNDLRGKIISKLGSTYYVFSTDCGNVVATDVVFPMPATAKDLVALAAKVTIHQILSTDSEVEDVDAAYFDITGEEVLGKWPCALKDSTEQKVVAKGFIEKPPESVEADSTCTVLKSGSTVELSGFCSENGLYLRSVGGAVKEKLLAVHEEMRKFAAKAESLTSPPDVGQLCCVKLSEDGCFYRAQVLGAVDGQKVSVRFVDFGNQQQSHLRDIRPLPDALKKIPFFAVKVFLAQVPSKPFARSATDHLEKLVTEGTELLLTYRDSISEGVTLKEKRSGASVNDFIKKTFEIENPEEVVPVQRVLVPAPDQGVLRDEDLKYTMLTSDSHCDLFLLYINEREFRATGSFWATDDGTENMLHVLGSLREEISARCAASRAPHRPAVREICLAEFEGDWYRALTVSTSGDLFNVFFLDFGNSCSLRPESIRKMEREFIEAPVLAVNCVLEGHQELLADPESAEKVLRALEERVNTTLNNVHVTEFEDDAFFVTIPEIHDILRSS